MPETPFVDPELDKIYMDDANGGFLPANKVKDARRLEKDYA